MVKQFIEKQFKKICGACTAGKIISTAAHSSSIREHKNRPNACACINMSKGSAFKIINGERQRLTISNATRTEGDFKLPNVISIQKAYHLVGQTFFIK